MKRICLIICLAILMCLTACVTDKIKRPIDYPDANWSSEVAHMEFTVSNGEIKSATIVDKNGQNIDISIIFSDITEKKITVEFADNDELIFEGYCTFGTDSFQISITDVYSLDFEHLPIILAFTRSEK